MADTIKISILASGVCRIETDGISGTHHQNAEQALLWIARELGGDVTRTRRIHVGQHIHDHDHAHDHDHSHN